MKPVPGATHIGGSRMPVHHLNRTFAGDHRISHKKKTATAGNFTMHDCYEKLKELVPTIPKNKKITRVQILQHVIDYIQDLQSALEKHNIDVHNNVEFRNSMGSVMEMASQFNAAAQQQQQTSHHHLQQQSCPNRTPFTTLPHQPTENVPPQQTQSNCNYQWQRQVNMRYLCMIC